MKKNIGIMFHLHEPELVNRYRKIALEEGFYNLIFFTPQDVDLNKRQINAYHYRNQRWIQEITPFPTIWYDLGYYSFPDTQKVRRIKKQPGLRFLGCSIGNKATIQKHLEKSLFLKRYLIPTTHLKQAHFKQAKLKKILKKYKSIMLKPLDGMGGEGIIRLSYDQEQCYLEQKHQSKQVLTVEELKRKMIQTNLKKNVLVQRWIDIRDHENHVFDIRVLMQKNAHFKWKLTGMAIRRGPQGSITSNLKGGGSVHEMGPYLEKMYGEKRAKKLTAEIKKIAYYIPSYLEKSYKKNLFELGLDVAVDRDRKIWIIEVNNKPGKTIFEKLNKKVANDKSVRVPIQYALSLLTRSYRKAQGR